MKTLQIHSRSNFEWLTVDGEITDLQVITCRLPIEKGKAYAGMPFGVMVIDAETAEDMIDGNDITNEKGFNISRQKNERMATIMPL